MQLTKGAIGNLINRYKAVLKKCHLMNTFGSLAVAGMLVMGGAAAAGAADVETITPAQDSKILYYNGNLYFADDTPTDTVVKNDDDTITAKLTNQNATFGVLTNLRKENGGDVSSIKITNSFFANNTGGGAVTLWGMGTGQDTLTKSISDSKFDNNSSNGNGGAVGIHKNTAFTTLGSTTFTTVKFEENTADENGGAIFAEAEKLAINKNDFKNNKAEGYGGAIFITQSSELDVKDSVFTENHAAESGGAIASGTSSKSMTITSTRFINNAADGDGGAIGNFKGLAVKDSYFEDNKAQQSGTHEGTPIGGGAIALGAESTTTIANTTFKNNTSGTNGGAIATRQAIHANNSAAKLDIAATFIGNKAQQGGAIYNSFYTDNGLGKGAGVTVTGTFSGNEATGKGGAIYNDGTLDKNSTKPSGGVMTITDATFDGNKADFGGAIFNSGTLTVNDGSFEGNTATKAAGAIYNAADAKLTVDGVTFASNSSAKAGAINSMAGKNETTTTIKNSKFNNNSAVNGMGGALANSSNAENGSTEGFSGKMSLTDTAFSGNTARNGGALWNGVQWTVDITGGSFDNNSAVTPAGSTYPAQGGAISNSGALNISGVTFSNNKTDGLGGAIFNTKTGGGAGSITFNGTNTFTNNTAASKANDIYNAGTITVAGGTTTLNSGLILAENGKVEVTGGTLDMASGSTLDMGNGTLTINGGTFVADAGLLIKNGATDGSYAANDANKVTDSSIVGTQGNLNLRWFDGDYTLGEYTSVKNALLNPSSEKAELTLLNAQLAVEDGKTLVTGAVPSGGTATLDTGAKVVNNDSTNVAGGTDVPHTPENYVSVVDKTDADRLLEVSTIETNGNSITAKGLKIAGAAGADAVTLKVTPTGGNNSTLTLVGDSKADTGVIDKDGKALATKAEVATNNTLNMGLTGNTQDQGLTLTEATVTGTLNANGGVTGTTSEYAINALTMQTNSQVNVLNSTMQIGQFTAAGGTMFVDPAYVKIDSVTGPTFGTKLLVGTGSTVNIGGMSEADMRQAMEKAGMSVGPNFTVGANQSVLVLGQALTLGASGKIVVDAGVDDSGSISGTPVSDDAYFGRDSLLVVNGNTINGATAAINLSGITGATLNVDNGAKLLITDAVDGTTYTIIDGETNTSTAFNSGAYADGTGWNGDNLLTSSDMVTLTSDDGTMFKAKSEDAHTVFPNLSHELATAVNNLYTGKLNNVDSDQMGVRFLSRATDNRFLGADKDAAASTIESAARMAFAGAVPQMTKMASDAGTNAVVNRLGFANPADGAQAMDAEGKIVDRNTTGFALWIAPLWQSQHGWGMDADSMDYGFNGNLGGVSLGADYTFENAIRAGITFNIGGGYAESSGGDLSSTDNRMNFWGLGAYAGWNYENFGVMADVSYTSTWNQLKQDVDSRMGMGDLEADVQATAISAGLRAEYLLQTSVMDIIPHIGVRYMSLNTWSFDAESNGGTVLEGDGFHQDIWTFPIGVTFSKDIALDNGFTFKPSVDFSVIPAAGDIKAKQDVAFTGLPGTYEVETQMMDYLTWQGGVGLELANDNMSIGVNYTLQAGQHTTGHGVFGSFRYEF